MNLEDWLQSFKSIGDQCLRSILQQNESHQDHPIPKGIQKKKIKKQKCSIKQPKSSYIIYWLKRSQEVRQFMPNHDIMAYLKIISQEWKDLSVEEKTIYEDQATIEREKYWQLLAEIHPSQYTKSNFHYYWYEKWNQIIKQNPDAQILATLKSVQLEWRSMTKLDKEIYCREQREIYSDQNNIDFEFNQNFGEQSNNIDENNHDNQSCNSYESDQIKQNDEKYSPK